MLTSLNFKKEILNILTKKYNNMKFTKLKSLSQFVNENIQNQKFVVSYAGRFQPFHKGHYDIYKQLVDKFGKENVYIVTADLSQSQKGKGDYDEKNFLSFNDKKTVMTTMYNIPASKIVKVVNTYSPKELTAMFDKSTSCIYVVGGKDAERLAKGKYYEMYNDETDMLGYMDKGYIYVQENNADVNISATEVRAAFRNTDTSQHDKEQFFKQIYGKFNASIFNLLYSKLNSVNEKPANENAELYPKGWKELDGIMWRMTPEKIKQALEGYDKIEEGGAFGHLEHIYDDYTLTFKQLKELVNLTLSNKLESAVEKTDGQALAISYKNGKLITARNKSEYKNFGENAADKSAIEQKFAGRGAISDAYMYAFNDLETAISKLPKKEVDDIFKEGKCFMHLEVMYIPTTNTVPYNVNLLVFHNVTEYDATGEPIGASRAQSDKLAKMIQNINQDVQKTFKIQGSPYIELRAGVNFDKENTYYINKITELQKKWGLSEENTLFDFYKKEWTARINDLGITLTTEQLDGLLNRWIAGDKSYRVNAVTFPTLSVLSWVQEFEKTGAIKMNTEIKRTIDTLFIEVAMTVIKSLQTFLAANPEESANSLKKELTQAMKDIENSGDEGAISKMKKHLERLNMVGGMDAVFPSEGIVFNYNGKLYKLTGVFADVHQIISTLKYKK